MEEGLAVNNDEFLEILKRPTIGGDEFCARIRDAWQHLASKAARPNDVDFRLQSPILNSQVILEAVCRHMHARLEEIQERRRNSWLRPVAALMLLKYAALTNRAAAGLLNLRSGEAVGIQARKAQKPNKQIKHLINAIEDDLRRRILDFGDKQKS